MNNATKSLPILSACLEKLGYERQAIELVDNEYVRFTKPDRTPWFVNRKHLIYPFMQYGMVSMAKQKMQSQLYCQKLNVSVAESAVITNAIYKGEKLLQSYGRIVIKPIDGKGSRGISFVSNTAEISTAYAEALKYSQTVIAQRYFNGEEYRFVVLDGHVASVLIRQRPRVIGDGMNDIRTLIKLENDARARLRHDYLQYPQLNQEMLYEPRLFESQEVPKKGEEIILGPGTMISKGASVFEMKDNVHESYKIMVETIAATCNPDFLVIDLLSTDITAEKTADNYVFLEFTTWPSLALHASVRGDNNFDLAGALAQKIDDWCRQNFELSRVA